MEGAEVFQIGKELRRTLVAAGMALALAAAASNALAAPSVTIRVNSTGDDTASDNSLTLREAILLVNGGTGGDGLRTGLGRALSLGEQALVSGGTIGVAGVAANIVMTSLPGLSTISITNATGTVNESLPPVLTSGVVINGLNGAGGRTVLSGASSPAGTDLLRLGYTNSGAGTVQVEGITVTNLVISGAGRNGLYLDPARACTISAVDINGTASGANKFALFLQGKWGNTDANLIENCTIGPNGTLGIVINRPGAHHNTVRNCRIGTNAAGTAAAPNTGAGVALFTGAHDNLIAGNVISGNTLQGIYLSGSAGGGLETKNNAIQGNRIGTAADGVTPLGNVQGVVFGPGNLPTDCPINNLVGGTGPGQGNIIAFNRESGVVVVGATSTGDRISANSIFGNGLLGIDLLDDKLPTAGISGGGTGPNRLALRPTLTSALAKAGFAAIKGSASPVSTIEVFVADPSPSGYGSGKVYCGSAVTDTSGSFSLVGPITCSAGPGTVITATSTLGDGSTSEFGNNLAAAALPASYLPLISR